MVDPNIFNILVFSLKLLQPPLPSESFAAGGILSGLSFSVRLGLCGFGGVGSSSTSVFF